MNIESLSLSFVLPPLAVAVAAISVYLARRYRRERDDAREQTARVWNQVREAQRNPPAAPATTAPASDRPPPHGLDLGLDEAEPVILKFRRRGECR